MENVSPEEKADARQVMAQVKEEWLSRPGVKDIDLGPKIIFGEETDQLAIQVYVQRKIPSSQMDPGLLIPPTIDGVLTDIIEVGDTWPAREHLFSHGSTDVFVSITERQRYIRATGLVVPVGVSGGLQGGFAKYLRGELPSTVWEHVRENIRLAVGRRIGTKTPVQVELDPSLADLLMPNAPKGEKAYIIAATAGDAERIEDLRDAAEAVVRLAHSAGIRRLVFIPLGTGLGAFRDRAGPAVAQIVMGIWIALNQLPAGILEQITLATLDASVLPDVRTKINLIRSNRAQEFWNDLPAREDLLGIKAETDALAETLLLREVKAPLAVGILGGWGSGKSTVMELMWWRMAQIRTRPSSGWVVGGQEDAGATYVGHIYQIWFNAWNYAKSNLWASLMQQIFGSLSWQLKMEQDLTKEHPPLLGGKAFEDLYASRTFQSTNALWETMKSRRENDLQIIRETKREAALLEGERDSAESLRREKMIVELDDEAELAATSNVLERSMELFGPEGYQSLLEGIARPDQQLSLEMTEKAIARLSETGTKMRIIRRGLREDRGKRVALIAGFVLFALLIVLMLTVERVTIVKIIGFLTSIILIIDPLLVLWLRTTQQIEKLLTGRDRQAEREKAGRRTELSKKLAIIRKNEEEAVDQELGLAGSDQAKQIAKLKNLGKADPPNLVAMERLQIMKMSQVAELQQRVGPTSEFINLLDLIRARQKAEEYESKLGLMHQIKLDFDELSNTLWFQPGDPPKVRKEKERFFKESLPRGEPRIILYIDDLDRCPPKVVVEVLEAVQLLLKTELFVVVLALDTRYITRSLEKAYKDVLLRDGDPSGLDYIEKIIGIPYRVRPIQDKDLGQFLRAQMVFIEEVKPTTPVIYDKSSKPDPTRPPTPPDPIPLPEPSAREETPLTPDVVRFLPEDYTDLYVCCRQVELTPRSVKRLVNVFKIIEVFWFRTVGRDQPREVKQTMFALLALSAAYPEIMREAFADLNTKFRALALHSGVNLSDFLSDFKLTDAIRTAYVWQLSRFHADVNALREVIIEGEEEPLSFCNISLETLGLETFNLVRSVSFVGDPSFAIDKADSGPPPNPSPPNSNLPLPIGD